ncbi:hypothetical protein H1C71_017829 [Ictidomys tridecemlineatus]|nr:hypothetical protein H1C71_017829 [Ictidomys tridecemlineatus]
MTVVVRALLSKGELRSRQGVGAEEPKAEGGSSRPGQAELRQRQQPPCPTDLIYAACSTSTAGWREAGRSCWVGGLCGGLARVGSPGGLRRHALSTLDSTAIPTRARAGVCDLSEPRTAVRLPHRIYLPQRCLASVRRARAGGQIVFLRPQSYRDS